MSSCKNSKEFSDWKVCLYLRKSRADDELERELGEGATLLRHKRTLLEYAKSQNMNVLKIFEEVVSGESLVMRPEMITLLKEIEQGLYDAVLVMDQQRLSRGDMEEQGVVLKTFKNSNTKIITPEKVYDLNDEFDEEYSEFEAFMSRKEYKMINKRLRRGVIRSVKEGNYLSHIVPFGYILNDQKDGRTLAPHTEQADIIKKIFEWYVNDNIGSSLIAEKLNNLGIKTNKGNKWSSYAITRIIKNPVYIGKVTWQKAHSYNSSKKKKANKTRPKSEWLVFEGKHDAIISEDIFSKAQIIIDGNYRAPAKINTGLTNPLAGLVTCKICGGKLRYRPYANIEPYLICINKCGNKSSKFRYIESKIIDYLKVWITEYETQISGIESETDSKQIIDFYNKNIRSLEKEIKELHEQKNRLHDFLEKGVYDISTFLERSNVITEKINKVTLSKDNVTYEMDKELKRMSKKTNLIPEFKNILEVYYTLDSAEKKNILLKTIIDKVEYLKSRGQRDDNFDIWIHPKIE